MMRPGRWLPCLEWARAYNREAATGDAIAAVIVTIMLIPQSLAYALLAGLPPEAGLYASILPLVAYALFGTSRTLAVGPVAVISLMTAAAIGQIADTGSAGYAAAAIMLAIMSGLFLAGMGLLRLGFLANFLSHPVIAGFITAAGIIIAASQLRHILGVEAQGHNLFELGQALLASAGAVNLPTLVIGAGTAAFLFWVRGGFKPLLMRLGIAEAAAGHIARTGPVLAVVVTTLAAWGLDLGAHGVALVGAVPQGLPPFAVPAFDAALVQALIGPAILISVIGFVESVSVAQTLAAKRRQRIDPDQELVGLGAANIASGMSGGFPVTGGFARSVVNFDAGAVTPAAGALAAIGILIATLFLTPLLAFLPVATLAATIIVAVTALIDLSVLKRTWIYSKADFTAVALTILVTLGAGVEAGVSAGVATSLILFLFRTSRPHIAEVGRVPGTEHFRNIRRHDVEICPTVLTLRMDESLYFANARALEEAVLERVAEDARIAHVILMCPAVNLIDASALESLEALNERLKSAGITLNLSEVKGPVTDRLARTDFLSHLNGRIYLSQFDAWRDLRCGDEALELHGPNHPGGTRMAPMRHEIEWHI